MAKDGHLKRQGIVRNTIREDLLFFALPAVLVFFAGLLASGLDGWHGIVVTVRELAKQPYRLPPHCCPNAR
jgi:hypothetical protein